MECLLVSQVLLSAWPRSLWKVCWPTVLSVHFLPPQSLFPLTSAETAMSKFFTSIQRTWFAWILDISFQYHLHRMPDPLLPFNARKSSWQKWGLGSFKSPALYSCTVSVPWILFFLGYSWCEDNLHTLLYYLELDSHFGKKRKAKQTNGDPLFCDDAVRFSLEAFFETAVLGINRSMCQSVVLLTALVYCPTVLNVAKYGLVFLLFLKVVFFFFFFVLLV